jgi:1-acyl-sn-glycerol-3-phosphate acyltransferase
MRKDRRDIPYPRRKVMRSLLRFLAGIALRTVGRLEITGLENLPESGPIILAGNHFHFADPVALLYLSRRQVEFVGGFRFPNAPFIVKFLPSLWGYFPVHRGAYSRSSLDYSSAVLAKGGVVGIFPEGGAWAQVLRYPRPGLAFLAAQSGAPVYPVGLDGFHLLFKQWRPTLTIRIGAPVGPFPAANSPALRKEELAQIGQTVMQGIAELLPKERRGVYAGDAKLREEAEKVAAYPFDQKHMRGM